MCPLLLKGSLVVSRSWLEVFKLGIDNLAHFPNPCQVGVDIAFAFLVEYPLAIEEYFHDALAARRDSYGCIWTVVPEKFIRHPRGDRIVASRYAVDNLRFDLAVF